MKHVKLDRGFGFIATDSSDVFFHVRDLDPSLPFDESLLERDVCFETVTTDKGETAVNVRTVA